MRNYQPKTSPRMPNPKFVLACLIAVLQINFSQAGDLTPDRQHPIVARVLTTLLTQYHYNHPALNDSVSRELLDSYLQTLDYNRLYFLTSDIAAFQKYRLLLDDSLRTGNLGPAFWIFNKFKQRSEERLAYVNKLLEKEFDFTSDEYYQPDREQAPWAASPEELDELWRQRIKNEALELKLTGKDWPGIAATLNKRYSNFRQRIEQLNAEDVFQYFMNALSESYDPHTNYFSPIRSQDFNIDMSLSFEGIGARLNTDGDYTVVVDIVPGGPADRSKQLWPNDKIVGVGQGEDGKMIDVIGMRLDDVVQMIRGKKETVVRLEIIPAGSPAGSPTKIIKLVRDKIVLKDREAHSDTVEVVHEGRKYKIGIITIPTFYADLEARQKGDEDYKSTTRDVRRLLAELQGAQIDGILIDLRRNGGGSLQEAIELTGLFIKDGPVVQVRNSNGMVELQRDPDPNIVYDGPLAVLVDRISASASEIFAAAIQDYKRGIVLGGQTYGKGTVQNLFDLNRMIRANGTKLGQLKVTIAKFYRVNGGTTQNHGVMPDLVFPSYYDETNYGERSEKHALTWDQISAARFTPEDHVSKYLSTLRLKSQKRLAANMEFRYLTEDVTRIKRERDKNSISLQEAKRKLEREQLETQRLARVNERRKAKGLPPLQKGDTIPRDDNAPDIVREESTHVLADLIALTKKDLIVKTEQAQGP
ncbi:MAG: carboxy terminal-processing peptidase [candidate division KSB1 bacterium]|nr:carboxy terminal-processing peptidase [candidate division KSB1 bacterium]MDZ7303044.1 carboxy terminal-processing peptidase [candidate division KSB1 bacterium]MDZ7312448.1 carboxy terminal-processing peptidase [candidate division KSB1 bacterium]